MSDTANSPVPGWYKPVVILAIVWNIFGLVMYLSAVGMFGDPTAGLSETGRAAHNSIPAWIMGAFAIGTIAGTAGSFGLLMRKAWAKPVLILSMVALLLMEGWIVFASGAQESFGLAVPIVVSLGAVLLAWLATKAHRSGWLA